MSTRIGINGFGRIGRNVLRAIFENNRNDVEVVMINDLYDISTAVHLLCYDSIYGKFNHEVLIEDNVIYINGKRIIYSSVEDPENIDWGKCNVDIVFECTGLFNKRASAEKHISAGAERVLISGPSPDAEKTVVYGVNHTELNSSHRVISNASCTTNCLAPIALLLNTEVGIESGYMTTVHAYTSSQSLMDSPSQDKRRARAAALSIIPTSTGATNSLKLVIPELDGVLGGSAIRVPTSNVSMIDLVIQAKRDTCANEVNNIFQRSIDGPIGSVLGLNSLPLVSVDFKLNPYSSIFDLTQTTVVNRRTVRVVAWYDNEWGFSHRMLDVAKYMEMHV